MERAQAVIVAAEHLHATEASIDGAYGKVTAALSALGDAQAAMARAHGKLNVTKTKIGCRTVATGGEDKGNEDLMPRGERIELRAVG